MKVYWKYTDWTLAYIFDHAVCCASAASSGRSLHLINKPVENEVKFGLSEQTFAQLREEELE